MYNTGMNSRSYFQFCALACALDVIGERWTMLIIRELLPGPRRFKDLMEGLPGISSNMLTERLKGLEEQGVACRRVLPPPAGCTVYELTPLGKALESAAIALGQWGSQFLPASLTGYALPSIGAMSLAIKAFFNPEQAQGMDETFELQLGKEFLQVQVKDGAIEVQQGQARNPGVIIRTDMAFFAGLFAGQIQPEDAINRGFVQVEGDPEGLSRFLSITGVQS